MGYLEYNVYLTPNQKDKLRLAYQNKRDCTLRIEPKTGNNKLRLTEVQVKKLREARSKNKSCDIKLSKLQIQQSGGFLPFLAPLLPVLAKSALGAAAASGVNALIKKIKGKGYILPHQYKRV